MLILLLASCNNTVEHVRIEPSFIEVTLDGFDAGSKDAPHAFSTADQEIAVSLRTLGVDGAAYPFEGDLKPNVRPGVLDSEPWITVTGGEWSGTVSIRNAFGPTRIWFTDEGDKSEDSTRIASWAVGVSPELWFADPTIGEFQTTDDIETNQLAGEFAAIRVADRDVVVTARDAAGLWVTDTSDAPGTYNNLYVYTFGRPDDAFAVGTRVTLLTGIDQEYLASTQLSYPTLETDGSVLPVPDAFELTDCEDAGMEGLEGARIRVTDGEIPSTFVEGSEDYADFVTYGQWPLSYGTCTLYIDSAGSAPDFSAVGRAGQTVPRLEGMLKQIFDKWVVVVVDAADIEAPADGPILRGHP